MFHYLRRGNILPIALIAFAIVGFIFMIDYSISGGRWPWSTEKPKMDSKEVISNTNSTANRNTNTATYPISKSCTVDTDCALDSCSGCFNQASLTKYADNGGTFLACMVYGEGYACSCVNSTCATSKITSITQDWKSYTSEKGWMIKYPSTYQQSITNGFTFPGSVIKISEVDTVADSVSSGSGNIYIEEYPNDETNKSIYAWQAARFPEPYPAGYTNKSTVYLGNTAATRFQVNVADQTVYYYFIRSATTLWQIKDERIDPGGQNNSIIIKTFTLTPGN